MLRCKDGSIYTGITTDLSRRMAEHFSKGGAAAKYTRSHDPLKLEAAWQSAGRSLAGKLEAGIKRLPKSKKEKLIKGEIGLDAIGGIDSSEYSGVIRNFRSAVSANEKH